MRVNCENCNTNFNLDEGLVKSTGSKVRCSKCKHIFVIYPPQPEADEPVVEEPGAEAAPETWESDQVPAGDVETADEEDLDAGAPDTAVPDEVPEGEDLDLSDIEKMLASEETPEPPEGAPEESFSDEGADSGDDASLDLSDIEKILDEEDDGDDLLDEKAEEDQDLVFDLDDEIEADTGDEQISPTTELDLGDLEKMFESDEALEPSMEETVAPEEGEELSMSIESEPEDEDLSLMPDIEGVETGEEMSLEMDEAAAPEPEEGEEALEFELESAAEEEETPQVTEEPEELSLDLGLEEGLLEEEPETGEMEAESLEMEIETEVEDTEAEDEGLSLEGDIELEPAELETEDLELESEALEVETEEAPEASDLEVEGADLDDALEMALDSQEEAPEAEEDGDISMEALEIEADEEGLTDFGEEDEAMEYPDDAVPDIPDDEDVFDEEGGDLDAVGDTEEEFEEVIPETTSGGGVKKLLGLLAVLLVIILLLGAFLFLHYKGILHVPFLDKVEIPFLSKQKSSQVTDIGNLKISYNVDDYRFLETEKAGKLFLITGKVKNDYDTSRSFIQMSGSLYTKGKTLADTATAYCGNVIADLELSQMTPAAIRTRLGNRSGENNSNVNIKPGEERSFMIVFFDLPESLDEFTVAVRGSEEAGA
jgi:predicted Zn finger-like uncharacterized protein